MHETLRVARKEFDSFFSSPTAFIFLGVFLGVSLFAFFWVETFFARNIADVRPLFEWMPILLVFLVAAITMRMWAEERRAGTLEFLLTAPVEPLQLVAGKFLACLALVGVALLLTLPIPLSVSQLGSLDWGPVFGGYIATLFLASAYIAIGLFVSARSDNAIVSLIATAVLCGGFYLIGSDTLTSLFGNAGSELLKLLGSGARFESITRGILDLRDLYFYASVVGVFLTLNVFVLEWLRWAGNASNPHHRRWALLSGLLTANLIAANLWLAPVSLTRIDLTEGNLYSISDATRSYLAQLQEPLLIRGYFSAETHPLLAPLVPRIRDLLAEYARAGGSDVRVEFIDPLENPELEQEAGEKFGIRPVAFRTADKYKAAVVNSYFDIVLQYGDEFEKLGFEDLIDVKAERETEIEVDLRNPEYDITRALRKILYAYQTAGDLFRGIEDPVRLTAYLSPAASLPSPLASLRGEVESLVTELAEGSDGRLAVEIIDPGTEVGAGGAEANELVERLARDYGIRPMVAGLFDPEPFWFTLVLENDRQAVPVPLPEEPSRDSFERSLEAALRRFSPGMLRTVALHTPSPAPAAGPHGMAPPMPPRFAQLRELLAQEHAVTDASLESGQAPAEADLLLVAAPRDLDEKQVFAIDQFLMQGGTVILSSSPFEIAFGEGLSASPRPSGLEGWLAHMGVTLEPSLVLDPQSSAFPVPVKRRLGGLVIQETQLLDYPYFVDVRSDGLDQDSGILGGLDQITVQWASPIAIDPERNASRKVIRLLESSPDSWRSAATNLMPDPAAYGPLGFPGAGDTPGSESTARALIGAVVEGRFESFFAGKTSPLLAESSAPEGAEETSTEDEPDTPVFSRVLDQSPDSARLIVLGSNRFLTDEMLQLASSSLQTEYLNPVQLVENAVDWSLEDRGLLAIRGRSQFSRTLDPLSRDSQIAWEYGNYAAALAGLALLWGLRWRITHERRIRYRNLLSEAGV